MVSPAVMKASLFKLADYKSIAQLFLFSVLITVKVLPS